MQIYFHILSIDYLFEFNNVNEIEIISFLFIYIFLILIHFFLY